MSLPSTYLKDCTYAPLGTLVIEILMEQLAPPDDMLCLCERLPEDVAIALNATVCKALIGPERFEMVAYVMQGVATGKISRPDNKYSMAALLAGDEGASESVHYPYGQVVSLYLEDDSVADFCVSVNLRSLPIQGVTTAASSKAIPVVLPGHMTSKYECLAATSRDQTYNYNQLSRSLMGMFRHHVEYYVQVTATMNVFKHMLRRLRSLADLCLMWPEGRTLLLSIVYSKPEDIPRVLLPDYTDWNNPDLSVLDKSKPLGQLFKNEFPATTAAKFIHREVTPIVMQWRTTEVPPVHNRIRYSLTPKTIDSNQLQQMLRMEEDRLLKMYRLVDW